ncbi:YtpR family tRNA-binding protein [Pediococcus siamensis]|uniref:YtpR family tRNA-binding protein n=1 Tax=Pediococcus siamensis TaxID=381829 RepID=UPI0039A33C49
MLISSYNPAELGDILVCILRPDVADQAEETKGNVTRIFDTQTKETLGYNFAEVSQYLGTLGDRGQVFLTPSQVASLNKQLENAGFLAELVPDTESKFVVGYVETADPHPDSDHLLVTQTRVGQNQKVQIVSGSPNMQAGIKVVVAKVGAMMPSGLIIWPGSLRGVESNGMICSGRELRLPNAPQKKGALILPDDETFEVGTPFNFSQGAKLFQSK